MAWPSAPGLLEPLGGHACRRCLAQLALQRCRWRGPPSCPWRPSSFRYSPSFCSLVAQPRCSAAAAALSTRVLRRLVQRVEGLLVDDHRVARQPGVDVVEVLHLLVQLALDAAGAGGQEVLAPCRWPAPGRSSASWIVTGCAPAQLRDARGGRVVGAHLGALQVGQRLHRLAASTATGPARARRTAASCPARRAASRAPGARPRRAASPSA